MTSIGNGKTVIVGMSGGVDSSVCAALLKEQGYNVIGMFMKNWEEDSEYCTAEQDYNDALLACDHLGLPLKTVNFTKEYRQKVFDHFLKEYSIGRTPNPDTLCNKEIKFKAFLDYALQLGVSKIATGHYAKKTIINSINYLKKATDKSKDQSYFLYQLGQKELKHAIFPLGEIQKKEVRKIAKQNGLINHNKKDSTGICFIGERKYNDFVGQYIDTKKGEIISIDGDILGTHNGHIYFTIGQRKGLGIGARLSAADKPWYVVKKDIKKNINTNNLVCVSPDVGGVERARALGRRINSSIAIVDKRRPAPGKSEVMNVVGHVKGKTCIIVDDIIDSGGTIVNAAKALKDKGAKDVYAYITHAVLSGNAVDKIKKSQVKKLIITDSIDNSKKLKKSSKIQVVSISSMMAEAIKRISNSTSVSSLFK